MTGQETENYIIKVGGITLDLTAPAVMTILNVTPDSFWQGSRRKSEEDIATAVEEAVRDGAKIIDVGGYSSRPGADDVTPEDEYARVEKAMTIIRERYPDMIVSIDTFRASVAAKVMDNFGPCIINDISAGGLDPEMIPVAAKYKAPYIAMHMRANPATMQQHTDYENITASVKEFFKCKIAELKQSGINDIIIDPGFGFAKTTEQNYQLMAGMPELLEFGYPILSGISRKSMIYKVLGSTPEESLPGTDALNWESLRNGAVIIRVHDTKNAADIVKIHNYYKEANDCEQ